MVWWNLCHMWEACGRLKKGSSGLKSGNKLNRCNDVQTGSMTPVTGSSWMYPRPVWVEVVGRFFQYVYRGTTSVAHVEKSQIIAMRSPRGPLHMWWCVDHMALRLFKAMTQLFLCDNTVWCNMWVRITQETLFNNFLASVSCYCVSKCVLMSRFLVLTRAEHILSKLLHCSLQISGGTVFAKGKISVKIPF